MARRRGDREPEGRRGQDDGRAEPRRGPRGARTAHTARRSRPPGRHRALPREGRHRARPASPSCSRAWRGPADAVLSTRLDGLSLLPRGRLDATDSTSFEDEVAREGALDAALARCEKGYDLVIVDTPSGLGRVTTAALACRRLRARSPSRPRASPCARSARSSRSSSTCRRRATRACGSSGSCRRWSSASGPAATPSSARSGTASPTRSRPIVPRTEAFARASSLGIPVGFLGGGAGAPGGPPLRPPRRRDREPASTASTAWRRSMKLNPPASSSDLEAARAIARRLHQRRGARLGRRRPLCSSGAPVRPRPGARPSPRPGDPAARWSVEPTPAPPAEPVDDFSDPARPRSTARRSRRPRSQPRSRPYPARVLGDRGLGRGPPRRRATSPPFDATATDDPMPGGVAVRRGFRRAGAGGRGPLRPRRRPPGTRSPRPASRSRGARRHARRPRRPGRRRARRVARARARRDRERSSSPTMDRTLKDAPTQSISAPLLGPAPHGVARPPHRGARHRRLPRRRARSRRHAARDRRRDPPRRRGLMPRLDPHSYADSDQPRARHLRLRLAVDFDAPPARGRGRPGARRRRPRAPSTWTPRASTCLGRDRLGRARALRARRRTSRSSAGASGSSCPRGTREVRDRATARRPRRRRCSGSTPAQTAGRRAPVPVHPVPADPRAHDGPAARTRPTVRASPTTPRSTVPGGARAP